MALDDRRLADILIRHAVASEQYGKQLADKIVRLLNSADSDLLEKLAARYALMEGKGFDRGPATTKRLEELLQALREINTKAYSRVADGLTADLTSVANHEADFAAKAANTAGARVNTETVVPSASFLKTLVTTSPIDGTLLGPWIDGLESARMDRLEKAIRIGALQGETTDDLVKRIRGTKAKNYTDGILDVSRRSAQTFAITANSTIQNAARLETFKGMKTIGFVEWSSILDSRTTTICQSLSGKIWPIDAPHPTPPAHPRCRSLLLPRANNTDAAKHEPFGKWLRRQPGKVQDEVLGKARGDIFRQNGEIDFAEFFRKDGTYKTLEDLKAFDAKLVSEPITTKIDPTKPFSPINPDIRGDTIPLEPRRNAINALAGYLKEAAADGRYDPRPEFRGVKDTDLGKPGLSSALTDQAASAINALMSEANSISDAFNIPRLRGIKSGIGNWVARMGDGVLQVNATYFNGYAAEIGGVSLSLVDKLKAEQNAVAEELKKLKSDVERLREARIGLTAEALEKATFEYLDAVDLFNNRRKEWLALDKKVLKARSTDAAAKVTDASAWKPGDDVKDRPYTSSNYFSDPFDRARATVYHEMAHHVHQMTGKVGRRAQVGRPPVEQELRTLFNRKFGSSKGRELMRQVASTYATTNEHEWFAENFAFYMMGRFDLVEVEAKELIERLLKEASR